ncbi:MAG: PEGA domain-containing protein, partial [Deltaproteobacteria bacterium]|nr:PEGA domain-containing protein [Deltaproteobacteria bacterium]
MKRLAVALLMVVAALPPAMAKTQAVTGEVEFGRVQVVCNVGQATVSLADFSFQTQADKTVIVGNVPVGEHQVEASKEGYRPWRGRLTVKAKATVQLVIK